MINLAIGLFRYQAYAYKLLGRNTCHWIGLKYRFPLLLHPIPYFRRSGEPYIDSERVRWNEVFRLEGIILKRNKLTLWLTISELNAMLHKGLWRRT